MSWMGAGRPLPGARSAPGRGPAPIQKQPARTSEGGCSCRSLVLHTGPRDQRKAEKKPARA
eukprot:1688344-Pyramimonas_sp.AAC.1